jgi:hypothetical protein
MSARDEKRRKGPMPSYLSGATWILLAKKQGTRHICGRYVKIEQNVTFIVALFPMQRMSFTCFKVCGCLLLPSVRTLFLKNEIVQTLFLKNEIARLLFLWPTYQVTN